MSNSDRNIGVKECSENADCMQMPAPQKEHEWLKQITGEWISDVEINMVPGEEPIKSTGTESVHMLGGFWAVTENIGEFMGGRFVGRMTLGYDPRKGKYVGTWIDSMNNHLWIYEGTLDAAGKALTLNTTGACPQSGKDMIMKEVLEIRNKDEKTFTSYVQQDGAWNMGMRIHYRRK